MLKYEAETCIRGYNSKGYLLPPINYLFGMQQKLPAFFQTIPRSSAPSDTLALMQTIPTQTQEIEELLRVGVKEGITYAKESLAKAKAQLEKNNQYHRCHPIRVLHPLQKSPQGH